MESLVHFFTTAPADPLGVAQNLWLIIALPILGAAVCGIFGRALGRANTNLIACSSVAASFALAVIAFWTVNDPNTTMNVGAEFARVPMALGYDYGTWFHAGAFTVDFGLTVDHLSGTLMLVITGVGFLIHLYSTSYMSHDDGYWRFFAYLNLFVGMMLILVMADNLVLLFVGWEGVGFCSYLLIGFWYTDEAKAFAGRKAFIANRVGDFAFVIGMLLLVMMMGSVAKDVPVDNFNHSHQVQGSFRVRTNELGPLNFVSLTQMARVMPAAPEPGHLGARMASMKSEIPSGPLAGHTYGGVLTAVLLLFLLGATGKSAQLPLYVWLPDAMAGPTPVSALIHAATMVTAGVYLFTRLSFLLVFSPAVMATVAIVGSATALFAALIAFAQDDIKKILAYSTISQLGYMFLGVGMGVFWAAILHLVTHAFFKACLFLGAGSVMHGNHDETSIKKLGGLRREMPWTAWTFLIATMAITGIVPLSGFFSKDGIIGGAQATHLAGLTWVTPLVVTFALLGAFCTAFYMMRCYFLAFEGERSQEAIVPHAHESDWPMTVPLVVLAGLSVLFIVWGLPFITTPEGAHQTLMENFLVPVFGHAEVIAHHARSFGVTPEAEPFLLHWALPLVFAWLIAIAGGASAAFAYFKFFPARKGQPAPAWARAINSFTVHKFYVDEVYDVFPIGFVKWIARGFYKVIDDLVIDRIIVRGSAKVTSWAGAVLRYGQTGDVQSYAAVMAVAVLAGVVYALVQVLK